MKQDYHSNSKTNIHFRAEIQKSNLSTKELHLKYNVSTRTIRKWRGRDFTKDKSSCPYVIERALSVEEEALILLIRRTTWFPLDEVLSMIAAKEGNISRSSVYRLFVRHKVNVLPQEEKDKCKKFKEYEPGYLHIDVTYMPKIEGVKRYLFVAIDRATRWMYYKVYDEKSADNAQDFLKLCMDEFPFYIDYILTDNGLEFTNRLLISKKGEACQKASKFDEECAENDIEHRCTKPHTPKTNGMVERVNGTIKKATILVTKYNNNEELTSNLSDYLIVYNFFRRHGSLQRELKVKTPYDAVCKWFAIKPEIFIKNPFDLKNEKLNL